MNIKSTERIKNKWMRVTSAAQAEYEEGVRNPRSSWAAGAKAAESSYEKGIQASIARKGYGKGVLAAGDATWSRNAIEKGPARFAQGVSLSGGVRRNPEVALSPNQRPEGRPREYPTSRIRRQGSP